MLEIVSKVPLVVGVAALLFLLVVGNLLKQVLFKDPTKPPVVFHWIPFLGSTIVYGREPFKFFEDCQKKRASGADRSQYGDVFTFILLGKPTTVCLGASGNNFVLNGKHRELSAEEVYSPLTTPVFGTDVVFDCPNEKFIQQKRFVKFGLTADAFRSYVDLIALETEEFIAKRSELQGTNGILDVPPAMAELTIYTASRSLQGKEVRAQFDSTIADLFHDLDMGFTPINFMLPWAPLPRNRARDRAHKKMAQVYMEIIQQRRLQGGKKETDTEDMIWNLMGCKYKDGQPIPDKEIAHMMIALLLGGHHSSSATISYAMLQMASNPAIVEELYAEQVRVLGPGDAPLTYEGLQKLTLLAFTVKETLRLHNPVHSIMRQVKVPLFMEGTPYVIPPSHVVMASPASSARDPQYFPEPMTWNPHRWEAVKREDIDDNNDDEEEEDNTKGLTGKGSNSPYLPFGGGRHRCIGERFAYIQLGVILALFVRNFKIKNVAGVKGTPETDFSVSCPFFLYVYAFQSNANLE
ncbi:hypothetical protein ASPZODRAFT_146004 [Penicilliopsis zonata CBS 506.65]|uniref:sterol 14alpha-demethylase n=1 Tax=Penicilliopsis zonata CBS 506.65 TaxID=1073090 RepID=A0A1L9S909_9EURO|nr:hypothetical protein ASPZODRAFT_146004 [Penicilliopsis zonata CBS 506.65]OJJ43662.1 hypothetical protein ASPZODRAFT_146004 [Penicilliopsis zonata CBS 506.65]